MTDGRGGPGNAPGPPFRPSPVDEWLRARTDAERKRLDRMRDAYSELWRTHLPDGSSRWCDGLCGRAVTESSKRYCLFLDTRKGSWKLYCPECKQTHWKEFGRVGVYYPAIKGGGGHA